MLSLILIFHLGKKIYELAEAFHKSKWGYAILAVVVFYLGAIVIGIIAVLLLELLLGTDILNTINDRLLGILLIPFGVLTWYLLKRYLEKKWKAEALNPTSLINKIGKESKE